MYHPCKSILQLITFLDRFVLHSKIRIPFSLLILSITFSPRLFTNCGIYKYIFVPEYFFRRNLHVPFFTWTFSLVEFTRDLFITCSFRAEFTNPRPESQLWEINGYRLPGFGWPIQLHTKEVGTRRTYGERRGILPYMAYNSLSIWT